MWHERQEFDLPKSAAIVQPRIARVAEASERRAKDTPAAGNAPGRVASAVALAE